jgi:hypothetical protein
MKQVNRDFVFRVPEVASRWRVDETLQRRDCVVAVDGDVGGKDGIGGRIRVRDARRFLYDQRSRLRHSERAPRDEETRQKFHRALQTERVRS